MIEEIAVVTRAGDGRVWIKRISQSACGACAQQASCGTSAVAKALPNRELEVQGCNGLKVGDAVKVTLDEAALLKGSLAVYLLPLAMMLAGIGLAKALLPEEAADAWLPEIALGFLLLAFRLVRLANRWLDVVARPEATPVRKTVRSEGPSSR